MISKKIKEKINLLKKVSFSMFPNAKTELNYINNFQLLIAILMSAQTTDIQVNKANEKFFRIFKSPID
jgi:endonuclease-3